MTSGFETGDDFVSRRLTFDVPVEGLQNLREMNQELERFRVNSEAAARGGESFEGYVRELGNAQERTLQVTKNLSEALERMASMAERGSASSYSTAIPQGYTAPFSPEAAGTGANREPLPTTIPSEQITSRDRWDSLARSDPRAYLNARHTWGASPSELPPVSLDHDAVEGVAQRAAQADGEEAIRERAGGGGRPTRRGAAPDRGKPGKPPSPPWSSWRNRAEQFAGTAGRLATGLGPGGSFTNLFGMAGQAMEGYGSSRYRQAANVPNEPGGSGPDAEAMGAASEMGGGEGGGGGGFGSMLGGIGRLGGGLLKGMGPVGAALTAVTAGLELEQKIGHQIQQYKNLGMIRGGGAGEGFGYEMQARMMALNPFITNEQSRQIIQSALTSGYTGKEFDTVTGFMTHNLTEMNMSVADSTKLLQTAATNSSESVQDITKSLTHSFATMKAMSASGYNTLPQREESFKQSYETMVQAGVDPTVAARIAGQSTNEFANVPGMGAFGGQVNAAANSNRTFEIMMGQAAGLGPEAMGDPDRIPEMLGGQGSQKYQEAKWKVIKQLAGWSRGNLTIFRRLLSRFGIDLPPGEAAKALKYANEIGTGSKNDPLEADKEYQRTQDKQQSDSQWQQEQDYAGGGRFGYPGGSGGTIVPHGRSESTINDRVMKAFGGEAMVGEPGKPDSWKEYDPNDKEQRKGLLSGKLHIRGPGDSGSGTTIGKLPSVGKDDVDENGNVQQSAPGSGVGRNKPSGNHMSGHVTISVQPASMKDLLKIPSYVPLTANEQQANAGYGTAQKNNPPPGDTVTTRGAR